MPTPQQLKANIKALHKQILDLREELFSHVFFETFGGPDLHRQAEIERERLKLSRLKRAGREAVFDLLLAASRIASLCASLRS